MFVKFLSLSLFCFCACSAAGAESSQLRAQLSEILRELRPSGATVGLSVRRLGSEREVFAADANLPLLPASVQKLFTTSAALDSLGPEHIFVTTVIASGTMTGGVLKGNLVLKGSGDPNISGRFHNGDELAIPRAWAEAVRKAGISQIEGDLVADDRLFDGPSIAPGWPADQLSNWYCAEVSALSFNDNCIELHVRPGPRPDTPALLSVSPRTDYVTLINRCVTVDSKAPQGIAVERRPGTNRIVVSGRIRANSELRTQTITVHEPALFLATVFREELARQGVKLIGKIRLAEKGEQFPHARELARTTSTLARTIEVANKRSQNLYAEVLLRLLGVEGFGAGTFEAGARSLRAFARKIGIPHEEFQPADGSGLSRANRASASAVTTLLAYMAEHPHWDIFKDSLAVAGVDGTLQHRLREPACVGKVRAKTGTISGVSTLAGYAQAKTGHTFAFAILVNDLKSGKISDAMRLQDAICRALVMFDD